MDVSSDAGQSGRRRTVASEKASEEVASTVTPSMRRLWPGQEKDDFSRKKKKKTCRQCGVGRAVAHVRNYEKDRVARAA